MLLQFCIALIAIGVGALVTFLCLYPRLKKVNSINDSVAQVNAELEKTNIQLSADNISLNKEYTLLTQQTKEATENLRQLNLNITSLERQMQEAGDAFYNKHMELARQKFETDVEQEKLKYEEAKKEYVKEFLLLMQDNATSFKNETASQDEQCLTLQKKVEELHSTVEAAVAAAKRAEEIKTQSDFYRLQLSATDIEEIKMMRNIAPCLRDQEPLNKVIWKVYYEKPTTDLIGRVIGSGVHTGIYKITNLEDQKCYVGQAVNLADRWKQHIKRGIGADPPTRNKLYPAMMAAGVENFSFEVIEECDRNSLDAREDYWQDYFKAKEFGYSIK